MESSPAKAAGSHASCLLLGARPIASAARSVVVEKFLCQLSARPRFGKQYAANWTLSYILFAHFHQSERELCLGIYLRAGDSGGDKIKIKRRKATYVCVENVQSSVSSETLHRE